VLKNNGFHNRHSPPQQFSPASFFANGEQGWWYDPSNFATLFQDSAGTTPVTAVEQPVGLQLDLSGRGNHRFQTTSANRPVVSARVNLLTKTEEFNDSVWVKDGVGTTVTANQAVAPDGQLTADLFNFTAGTGKRVRQNIAVTSGQTVTFSISAESVTGPAPFGLVVAGVANTNNIFTATLTEEWQVFTITTTFTAAGTAQFRITGNDLTSAFYAWD
jgi:hypothetical protein